MKKIIFIFLAICLPLFAQDRVKVASTSNPSQNKLSNITTDLATQNNLTIPGTLSVTGNIAGTGADNLLNNQTLTGAGSIMTRSLGDARYVTNIATTTGILPIANGGTGTNTTQLTGNWSNTGNFNVNGTLTVSNNINGFGSAFTISNNALQVTLVSTGATSSVNIDMYNGQSPVNRAIISLIGATNSRAVGTLPRDLLFRSDASGRLSFSAGTALQGYWDMSPATKAFVILPASRMIISNTLDVTGIITGNSALNVSSASTFGNNLFVTNVLTASSIIASTNFTINGKPANWKQTFFPANMADGSFYDSNPPSRFAMSGSAPFMASLVYTNNQNIVAPAYPLPASQLAGRQVIIRTIIGVNSADTGDIVVVQGISNNTNLLQNAGWNVGNSQVNSATTITKTMPATAFGAVQFVSTNLVSTNAVAASAYAYPNRQAGGDTYTSNVFLISTEVEEIQ